MEQIKCPICNAKYKSKESLYEHMEENHANDLNNMPADQYYFNDKYKISGRNCLICGRPVEWNKVCGRYNRLCNNPKCKQDYRELFQKNMKKVYGTDNLLVNPDQQVKMLQNRSISGKYKWHDGSAEIPFTGTYEEDFLKFCDIMLNLKSSDILAPASMIIKYKFDDKEHFYIPDFEIISLNLVVEIKASDNNHYRKRDLEQEEAKDTAIENYLLKQTEIPHKTYIKIFDKKYADFFEYLVKRREAELSKEEEIELIKNRKKLETKLRSDK